MSYFVSFLLLSGFRIVDKTWIWEERVGKDMLQRAINQTWTRANMTTVWTQMNGLLFGNTIHYFSSFIVPCFTLPCVSSCAVTVSSRFNVVNAVTSAHCSSVVVPGCSYWLLFSPADFLSVSGSLWTAELNDKLLLHTSRYAQLHRLLSKRLKYSTAGPNHPAKKKKNMKSFWKRFVIVITWGLTIVFLSNKSSMS